MVCQEKVLNSPSGPLQLRSCVMVLLLFQLSSWRRSAVGLWWSLPLQLQVKGHLQYSCMHFSYFAVMMLSFHKGALSVWLRYEVKYDIQKYIHIQKSHRSQIYTVCYNALFAKCTLNTKCTLTERINLTLTWDGTFLGGSIRIVGSHSPGGRTVTWSRNSSIPERRSVRSLALYATSWKIYIMNIIRSY